MGDQLRNAARRHGRVHHEQARAECDQRDGGEVAHDVEGQVAVERGVGGVRAHGRHHQGVAVGGAAGHVLGGDVAGGAGAVLHHHGLAQPGGDALRHHAGGGVGAAARREADHEADRAVGTPGGAGRRWLRAGGGRGNERHGGEQRKEARGASWAASSLRALAAPAVVRGTTTVADGGRPINVADSPCRPRTRPDFLRNELFPAEQARIVRLLVERVAVGPAGADIRLRVAGLTSLVRDLGAGAPTRCEWPRERGGQQHHGPSAADDPAAAGAEDGGDAGAVAGETALPARAPTRRW